MGPRFLQRGNFVKYLHFIFADAIASMGPRFLQRGNPKLLHVEQKPKKLASMGPRFLQRGNSVSFRFYAQSRASLQWGHAFYSVEIC